MRMDGSKPADLERLLTMVIDRNYLRSYVVSLLKPMERMVRVWMSGVTERKASTWEQAGG